MSVNIRAVRAEDAAECGRILYEAFAAIGAQHNFPPDFPSIEVATGLIRRLVVHPGARGFVAEENGRVLGSNFMSVQDPIAGIGPITVDPHIQNRGVGRRLMQTALDHAQSRHFVGIRLVQAAYHNRTMSLYTRLGFVSREPLSVLQGPPLGIELRGYRVRPATASDQPDCDRLCERVHGVARPSELAEAIAAGEARVVERLGRITGCATGLAFFTCAVGETNDDVKALIGAAPGFGGPGILVPTRNHELLRWCLEHGLRIVMPMTLMSIGLYNEPQGAWLPSILY